MYRIAGKKRMNTSPQPMRKSPRRLTPNKMTPKSLYVIAVTVGCAVKNVSFYKFCSQKPDTPSRNEHGK